MQLVAADFVHNFGMVDVLADTAESGAAHVGTQRSINVFGIVYAQQERRRWRGGGYGRDR